MACPQCGHEFTQDHTGDAGCNECREFARIMDSIDRYNQMDPEEVECDEYQALLSRYEELRERGHGPQHYEEV